MDPKHRAIINSIRDRLLETIDIEVRLQTLTLRARGTSAWWHLGAGANGRGQIPPSDLETATSAASTVLRNIDLQETFEDDADLHLARATKAGVEYLASLAAALGEIHASLRALHEAQTQKDRRGYDVAFENYVRHSQDAVVGAYKGKAGGNKSPLSRVWNAEDVTLAERVEAGGEVSWDEYIENSLVEGDPMEVDEG
ncbi:hypothetical protein F5B22DRAFT_645680 [Xylaria bambusicola]|uniref:uncharacterized protein n=1 Tax=Xylaria bambusicola TaxID=326684 RepID=UPI002007DA15|nr:uncharacterized protein F5B22DRAFT_645680 [Xylaria bambusicola]KAI0517499.1 hypothetical protein F5B22DRAFT_645680 [Xylaria bambusicola]